MKKSRICAKKHKNIAAEQLEDQRKQNKRELKDGITHGGLEIFADQLRIPKEVCCGSLRATLTGNTELYVENYQGILEYTQNSLLLQGRKGRLLVEGENLTIAYYTCEDMLIKGRIRSVSAEA